jgi:hypothetical protein
VKTSLAITLCLVTAAISGCATAPQEPQPTSVTLERVHIEKVQSAFALACANNQGRIVNQTVNSLECAKPMGNSFKETLYKAAATENYASNPDFHYQWTFVQTDSGVIVNSYEWLEHQNAFGKTTRVDVAGGDASGVMVAVKTAWLVSPAYQESVDRQR